MEVVKKTILRMMTTGHTIGCTGNCYVIIPDTGITYNFKFSLTQEAQDIGFFDAYIPPPLTVLTVVTSNLTNITKISATGGGNVLYDGGLPVTARGVVWNTTGTPTIADTKTTDGTGIGAFTSNLTGLVAFTKYYVRAYATNSGGTAYGEVISFIASSMPTVTTAPITAIGNTIATGGGTVTSVGDSPVFARGIVWSINADPTIADSKTVNGMGIGTFVSNITSLAISTQYHVRAYATNDAGTAYGNDVIFSTLGLPIVVTTAAASITQTGATLGGNVTSDGGSVVYERGITWSTSPNPTIDSNDYLLDINSGIGIFTIPVTGLTKVTTYYVRAFASNDTGIAYGNQVTFTTRAFLPTITTDALTSITYNSAVGGGNVTDDGGATVTARGVCWSTSPNPTTANSKTTDGTGTGTFTSSLTGLAVVTTYYVRAYATNAEGTAYGNEVSFVTLATIPTVTTNSLTSITYNSATGGGNVTSDGGSAVTTRGICWSTSSSPTTANSKTTDGSGNGAFTSSMTGLVAGTTYYVRAYATNGIGTSYGNEVVLTTTTTTTSTTTAAPTPMTFCLYNTTLGSNFSPSYGCINNPLTSSGQYATLTFSYDLIACGAIGLGSSTLNLYCKTSSSFSYGLKCQKQLLTNGYPGNRQVGTIPDVEVVLGNELCYEIYTTADAYNGSFAKIVLNDSFDNHSVDINPTRSSTYYCDCVPPTITTTTTTTTTTAAPVMKDVNFNMFYSNSGDYTIQSCKCSNLVTNGAMSAGQQFYVCINSALYNPNISESGSYALVHIGKNGTQVFYCCLTDQTSYSSNIEVLVNYGDTVCVHNDAHVPSIYCTNNISCSRIYAVVPTAGLFQVGTTCPNVCAVAGGVTPPATTTTTTTTTSAPSIVYYPLAYYDTGTASPFYSDSNNVVPPTALSSGNKVEGSSGYFYRVTTASASPASVTGRTLIQVTFVDSY